MSYMKNLAIDKMNAEREREMMKKIDEWKLFLRSDIILDYLIAKNEENEK